MRRHDENIKRFEQLLQSVSRDGVARLLSYIKSSDFFIAPASTRFHGAYEGGLLQHSLNVFDCLMAKKNNQIWSHILEEVGDESLTVMSLLHDICKTYFYAKGTKNQKTYDSDKVKTAEAWQVKHDALGDYIWETVSTYQVDNRMPLGHGEKSVFIIQKYMRLTTEEIYAIRWHMGFSEPMTSYSDVGAAMEKYPIVLALYEADLEASKILEREE